MRVLREWLQLRAEPKTMLAVKLAAEHHLVELRDSITELLEDVDEGTVFHPALRSHYSRRIREKLDQI